MKLQHEARVLVVRQIEYVVIFSSSVCVYLLFFFCFDSNKSSVYLQAPKTKKRDSALDQGVSLSTVHQAKGNEWSVVFVVHSTEGMMPMEVTGDSLEEERRIDYVAMTRAKETLYMSWHRE